MARPASKHPTDGELEILKILWDSSLVGLGHICTEIRRVRPVGDNDRSHHSQGHAPEGIGEKDQKPQGISLGSVGLEGSHNQYVGGKANRGRI